MVNPNTTAIKGAASNQELFISTLESGLYPVATAQTFPTIVYRWNMKRVFAPAQRIAIVTEVGPGRPTDWVDAIWVEAWVFSLFFMRRTVDAFTNAWTTVQENKPRILELKILYDAAVLNPEQKIVILTELLLSQPWTSGSYIAAAVRANLKELQNGLEGDGNP